MSEQFGLNAVPQYLDLATGISEPEIYSEHRDALDATLFRPDRDACELVFELEAGELRVRRAL